MTTLDMMKALTITGMMMISASPLVAQDKPKAKPAKPKLFQVTRNVEYGRAGDRSLKLDLYQPTKRSADTLPVVVWIHGGGWRTGNKSNGSRLINLVRTGKYVGVSVGYRLSGEALWPAQIHDCKAAIRWIRANAQEHGIDPERIGVWGSSAGGHLVSLLGTSSDVKELAGNNGSPDASSRVACVVDFCGPADMAVFKHMRLDQLFGKPHDERQTEATEASPVTYVSEDDPPILIVHGTKDGTVPISQAETFHQRLKKAGVDVTFVKMEGGGHGIAGKEVILRVNNFLAKHLHNADVEVSDEPIAVKAK